jgi:hypothetical protein
MAQAPAKIRRVDFYPDDWLAGTRGMSQAECGLYWNLCALMYALGECPIELEQARKIFGDRNFNRLLRQLLKRGKVTAEGPLIAARRVPDELLRARRRVADVPLTTDKPLTDPPRARAPRRARDNHQSTTINHQPAYGPLRDPVEIAKDLGLTK